MSMLRRGSLIRGTARSICGRLSSTTQRRPLTFTHNPLFQGAPVDVHPEVEDALANGCPVVALESTIITHGMPYPTSLEMARSLEDIVRSTGSIPATIGLIEGRIKIGLQPGELERLASRSADPVKLSRRDIAAAIALRKDGGTTCSSTLIFAALAGIKVFATGGLGGVHRKGESTMDVSADLHELSRCPVGLVSAGVKSILDIGRTLEYLETLGVPVVSYAESNDFPAFFTRRSGFKSPWNVDDPQTAARILYTQKQLGMSNGALFAVPIPESYEAIGAVLQEAVETAVRESEEAGVSKLGKEVTPWLLKRVGELTCGKSLESNIALVQNTALVGGRIAAEYAKIANENGNSQSLTSSHIRHASSARRSAASSAGRIAVLRSNLAKQTRPLIEHVLLGKIRVDLTTEVGSLKRTKNGGPTRKLKNTDINIEFFWGLQGLLWISVFKLSVTRVVSVSEERLPSRQRTRGSISAIPLWSSPCASRNSPSVRIPSDSVKSTIMLPKASSPTGATSSMLSENWRALLAQMYQDARMTYDLMSHDRWWSVIDSFGLGSQFRMDLAQLAKREVSDAMPDLGTLSFIADKGVVQMAVNLLPFFQHLVIKCGRLGVVVVMRLNRAEASAWEKERSNPRSRYIIARSPSSDEIVVTQHFPPLQVAQEAKLNTTGAGDSLVGALLAVLAQDPKAFDSPVTLTKALDLAQQASILTLQSPYAVSPSLSSIVS
ncbi:hypothetical protein PAXINDRAFT_105303 [Paxillus involutus ATCC 200175]|nr:hypothetical protein PAXINDRAFT_105303 [Paxillus involutus ATCC 200175]